MRRGRIFFYLAFILILGLAAVLVVYQTILKPKPSTAKLTPTVAPERVYVVIGGKLAKGHVFTEKDFVGPDGKTEEKVIQAVLWPKEYVSPGMFTEAEKANLLNKQTKMDLDANTPVMESMLVGAGDILYMGGSTWSPNIPTGMLAVSIPISRLSSVSYAPRPGDHVNLIVTLGFVDLDTDFQTILPDRIGLVIASGPPNPESKQNDPLTVDINTGIFGKTVIDPVLGQAVYVFPSEAQRPRVVSQMLIQDAVVLQVGDFPLAGQESVQAKPQATAAGNQPQPTPTPIPKPETITLIVAPQDAVTLNYLMFNGAQLTLALRNPKDQTRIEINPVTLQFLLDQYRIPVPVRLPYGLHPRIDQPLLPTAQSEAEKK